MIRNASIIAVTSGKGGVGKTHISANLGILLARQNRRTCIIDADHGMANINWVLGIRPVSSPANLFEPDCCLDEVVFQSDWGIDILPLASGISRGFDNIEPSCRQINTLISRLKPKYDIIIIDTAGGINSNIRHYLEIADHVLLTINPEPASLTDAFGLIRKMKPAQTLYNIIINRVSNAASAAGVYKRFAGTVRKYMGTQVEAIGYISEDSFISAAALSQIPVVNYSSNCLAAQCLKRITRMLIRKMAEEVTTKPPIKINQPPPVDAAYSAKVTPQRIQQRKHKQTPTHALIIESNHETRHEKKPGKERAIEALSTATAFAQNKPEVDPFEMWLSQLSQYFDQGTYTEKTRQYRKRRLAGVLETLCSENTERLTGLESLVVNTGVKDAENILEQTNLTNCLAKIRPAKEPSMELDINQPSILVPRSRHQNAPKAFSIISKLK